MPRRRKLPDDPGALLALVRRTLKQVDDRRQAVHSGHQAILQLHRHLGVLLGTLDPLLTATREAMERAIPLIEKARYLKERGAGHAAE